MSSSEDVKSLFRRFGGNASTYREIVSRDQVGQAEQKWPILKQINPAHHDEAPSVRRAVAVADVRQLQAPQGPREATLVREPAFAEHVAARASVRAMNPAVPDVGQLAAVALSPKSAEPVRGLFGGFASGLMKKSPKPAAAIAHSPERTDAAPPQLAVGGMFARRAVPQPIEPVSPSARFDGARPQVTHTLAQSLGRATHSRDGHLNGTQSLPAAVALGTSVANGGRELGRHRQDDAGGLAHLFASKLAASEPQQGVGKAAIFATAQPPAGNGLATLFERMAEPVPAPSVAPPDNSSVGRKRSIKW